MGHPEKEFRGRGRATKITQRPIQRRPGPLHLTTDQAAIKRRNKFMRRFRHLKGRILDEEALDQQDRKAWATICKKGRELFAPEDSADASAHWTRQLLKATPTPGFAGVEGPVKLLSNVEAKAVQQVQALQKLAQGASL